MEKETVLQQIMERLDFLEMQFKEHRHFGTDTPELEHKDLIQGASFTTRDGNSANSGDATTDTLIENIRDRVDELVALHD